MIQTRYGFKPEGAEDRPCTKCGDEAPPTPVEPADPYVFRVVGYRATIICALCDARWTYSWGDE